ncbi:MAG: FCD domain-containing protein [Sphingomonadaceae bacterium]
MATRTSTSSCPGTSPKPPPDSTADHRRPRPAGQRGLQPPLTHHPTAASASGRTVTVLQPIVERTALRYSKSQLDTSLSEHVELLAAIEKRDADWARAVMVAHIRRAFHVYVAAARKAENGIP